MMATTWFVTRSLPPSWRRVTPSGPAAPVAASPPDPVNPQLLFPELSHRVPSDALLAVDVGSVTYWYARHIRMRGQMQGHLSSTLASMGSAMHYAVAGKLAHPDRLVVALGRRRHADERHQRAHHGGRSLANADGSPAAHPRARQRRSQRGHVGATGDGGGPLVPHLAMPPSHPVRRLRDLARPGVDQGRGPAQVAAAWNGALRADRPFLIHPVVDPPCRCCRRVSNRPSARLLAALDQENQSLPSRARTLLLAELPTRKSEAATAGTGPRAGTSHP